MRTIKCKRCLIIFTIIEQTSNRQLCNDCQVETMGGKKSEQFFIHRKNHYSKLEKLVDEVTACIEFTEWEPKLNTNRLKEILEPLIK